MLRVALLSITLAVAVTPTAAAAKTCDIDGEQRSFGATYVTTLTAKKTSCGTAKGVVRAYHDCRGSGKSCGRSVNGYSCSQKVTAEGPIQYDAKVTCKSGAKKVKHTYSQNT